MYQKLGKTVEKMIKICEKMKKWQKPSKIWQTFFFRKKARNVTNFKIGKLIWACAAVFLFCLYYIQFATKIYQRLPQKHAKKNDF